MAGGGRGCERAAAEVHAWRRGSPRYGGRGDPTPPLRAPLQLAAALLKSGGELAPDAAAAVAARATTVAAVTAELLPRLRVARIREVLDSYGLSCHACSTQADYLVRLVPLLRLPVRVADVAGEGLRRGGG